MHVYIHVPFCARRCSYCDFAIAVRRTVPVDEYLRALRLELARAQPAAVRTIYIGGGTPSRLGPGGIARLLDVVHDRYSDHADVEITLEANPEDVTRSAAEAWQRAGVTRLSLGVQSFDDHVLRWMHRVHDAAAAGRAFGIARDAGFANISLDLIFALPSELGRDWMRDLDTVLMLGPEHVSLYGLTVEPGTPVARWRDRGTIREAPEESYEREYLEAHRRLADAGFVHYEVSNFARDGFASRHNTAYWTLAPYAGHGPSAHAFDGSRRYWNEPVYSRWVQRLHSGCSAVTGGEELSGEQRQLEQVYLGLRTLAGYEIGAASADSVGRWVTAGWATTQGSRVVLTAAGWLRLDALTSVLTGSGSTCNV